MLGPLRRMFVRQPESRRVIARLIWGLAAVFLSFLLPLPAFADQLGSASGLPVPRYVSLKSDRVNLHEGPSKDHRTIWVFQRAGLPVEITAEFGDLAPDSQFGGDGRLGFALASVRAPDRLGRALEERRGLFSLR